MAPPRHTLKLEALEARDVPSASLLGDFVGVVRGTSCRNTSNRNPQCS